MIPPASNGWVSRASRLGGSAGTTSKSFRQFNMTCNYKNNKGFQLIIIIK